MTYQDTSDLTAKAYRSIRRMILDGGLQPGQRMSHRILSENLGIGRSPVRDAILQLEAEGLVVQRGQKGVLLRELTPKELGDIYELRLVIEPFLAERAALLANVTHLAELRRICEECNDIAARPDLAGWFATEAHRLRVSQLDMLFHTTILDASGNSIATKFFGSAQVLALTFAWYQSNGQPEGFAARIGPTATEHQAVFDAILARDPAAARERMRDHVKDALLVVPERYALLVKEQGESTEKTAAGKAASAVRRRRS
jgi:DNA-binding GntR family transcriptional regulator